MICRIKTLFFSYSMSLTRFIIPLFGGMKDAQVNIEYGMMSVPKY